MELYFGSMEIANPEAQKNMFIFSIPDIGVKFKAPFAAEDMALDYAALLSLLEFVELNPQLFGNRALELFCNNYELVKQVNNSFVNHSDLAPMLKKAIAYRKRLNFTINWVPENDNPIRFPEID